VGEDRTRGKATWRKKVEEKGDGREEKKENGK
jgi:hypothetical protein